MGSGKGAGVRGCTRGAARRSLCGRLSVFAASCRSVYNPARGDRDVAPGARGRERGSEVVEQGEDEATDARPLPCLRSEQLQAGYVSLGRLDWDKAGGGRRVEARPRAGPSSRQWEGMFFPCCCSAFPCPCPSEMHGELVVLCRWAHKQPCRPRVPCGCM